MNYNDVIGFTALLGGAYYWGSKTTGPAQPLDLFTYGTWVDIVLVIGLLIVGFYFSVVLS
jgi:hypothetical protein